MRASSSSLVNVVFVENGLVDVDQLNLLYQIVGWDAEEQRTHAQTVEMLRVSRYYIAAYAENRLLVGFARVAGDPYIAQVLDVITHPVYRRQGIATRCMQGILGHLRQSNYLSVTLTDGSGLSEFYTRFGFRQMYADALPQVWCGA